MLIAYTKYTSAYTKEITSNTLNDDYTRRWYYYCYDRNKIGRRVTDGRTIITIISQI